MADLPRILVVEDEPGIAFALEADLQSEGYIVTVETRGDAAAKRAREESYDLLLLDVMLPGKDGFDVCREIRRAGVRTPIIVLTAKSQEAEKVMGLELGADRSPRSARASCARVSR
jgi:DNA-binding response OmpR family regulator